MSKFELTFDQKKVVNSVSPQLLVSASAGSGKTATLIEKIYDLIANKKVDVDKLLVITFTESASNEMKMRLKNKLFENAENSVFLKNQIDKISTSDVSTIHAMCAKMLRKYFYKLDINPNFCILDENNSKYLKAIALEKVLQHYSENSDEKFIMLSSIFGGGRNFSALQSAIVSYNDFLCAVEDREKYKTEISSKCYTQDLKQNEACEFLNNYIASSFYYFKQTLKAFLDESKIQNADYFEDFINQVLVCIDGVSYNKEFLQNHKEVFKIEFPKISQKKMSEENKNFKEEFKPFYDLMKKQFNDIKSKIVDKTPEELSEDLRVSQQFVCKFNEVESRFYEEYTALKRKRNSLDFADLESYFLKLLSDEEVRVNLASNYKYIFVDEYQDINSTQEQILNKLLLNNTIIMVGDVKQSIYGFRNSSPAIFVDKSKRYLDKGNGGQLINLNENFRSNPKILSFVNKIFSCIMSNDFGGVDYAKDSMLVGKTEYKDVDKTPNIELCIIEKNAKEDEEVNEVFDKVYSVLGDKNKYSKALSNARMQGMLVAKKILELLKTKIYDPSLKDFRNVKFSDIAILSRGNEFLKEISKVLSEYKVPISVSKSDNIYKDKDVVLLLSLLKIVNNMHDDIALSIVLNSFIFNFSFDELNEIRAFSEHEYFYQCFEDYAISGKDEKLRTKIASFEEEINEIRFRLANYNSIYEVFMYLQNKYDYLNYFKSLPNGKNRFKVVKDFVESFEGAEYNYDLAKFLQFVKNFEDSGKVSSKVESSQDSVKLSTIHVSKGLEYPIVFLVNCDKDFSNITFRSEVLKDKSLGLGLLTYNLQNFEKCENLAHSAISLNLKRQEKAEELRLLYVALTRAKNNLYIIGQANLLTVNRVQNSFEASRAESFMPWILSAISETNFNLFFRQGKDFKEVEKDFELGVKFFNQSDFEVKAEQQSNLDFLENGFDGENKLKELFEFNYEKPANIAIKNTVSSMLQEYSDSQTSFNFEPKRLTIFEGASQEIDSAKLGTIYHNIMQKVDFKNKDCLTKEYLDNIIHTLNIEQKYLERIDKNSILNCIQKLCKIEMEECLKEQPFLSYLPYNKIFLSSNISDKILIQGVADLMFKSNGKYYLIDYKTTRVSNPDQLVEKYALQLKLYKTCLEKALNIDISGTYVYSFCLNDFVKIV